MLFYHVSLIFTNALMQKIDAVGNPASFPFQKVVNALRLLSYGYGGYFVD